MINKTFWKSAVLLPVAAALLTGNNLSAKAMTSGNKINNLVPARDISYASEEVPVWKLTWDKAREMSRNGNYQKALANFAVLLNNKPNLDEARWEYISVLLHLEKWYQAEKQLNLLLAKGQKNTQYLFAQAKIALHTDNQQKAEQLYRRLLTLFPAGQNNIKALDGLSRALIEQGKHQSALPVVEKLMAKRPDNQVYIRRAALLYVQVKSYDKADKLLSLVYEAYPTDAEVIKGCAQVAGQQGDEEKAARFWQELIAVKPYDNAANSALVSYYQLQGNLSMELIHLERLLQTSDQDISLSKRKAEIFLKKGRADRALEICDSLTATYPDDQSLLRLRRSSLVALATDLLALVENSGSKLLWEDLLKVTYYRVEVYKIMADFLREKGELNELADILLLIAKEVPESDPVWQELEGLLKTQGRGKEFAALHKKLQQSGGQSFN
ncbi:lipopolysaccharide assembly protein LapB [Desulfogranum marinum]|uniref:tetratricopeptide repeat protein n=1 Tax=Desulfogranum marinum TaxID=453220 RepID=UPI0019661684|nr:tetratricopeptide repeat protein [Desulfogranum marinum]MBM9511628.1 tetratricopeptide repeat protein [Desulfogranum marinum]